MQKSKTLAAVVLAVAVFGLGWAAAQTKRPEPQLTAQDYFEIQMLYGRYTHSIDHGEKDGMDYAGTFLPDGILITVGPAVNPCPSGESWEPATRDEIRGSIADVKNVDVCIRYRKSGAQGLA